MSEFSYLFKRFEADQRHSFGLDSGNPKFFALLKFVKSQQIAGTPIDAIGTQTYISVSFNLLTHNFH